MEKTLVLIKPDAIAKNIIGKIISIYEENALSIEELKMISATQEILNKHYAEHKNKPFFNELISSMEGEKIVALIISGDNSIAKVRKINGNSDPMKASKGTIRNKYGKSITENSVHASSDSEAAKKEIKIWFGN